MIYIPEEPGVWDKPHWRRGNPCQLSPCHPVSKATLCQFKQHISAPVKFKFYRCDYESNNEKNTLYR